MSTHVPAILPPSEGPSWRRWILAIIIVALVHAGFVYWLLHRTDIAPAAGQPEAVVMMTLPPMAVAQPQQSIAEAQPPGPEMTESQPDEVEPPQDEAVPDLPPAPKPEAVLMTTPKPKPAPRKKIVKEVHKKEAKEERKPPAPRTTAPPRHVEGARASRSTLGAAGSSAAAANWRSMVSAQLNRNKRYPESAQGQQGTAAISFSVDRRGRVVSVRLTRSSGSSVLDQAAVAMARRSSPFPPPPAEVGGGVISLSVPVSFHPR